MKTARFKALVSGRVQGVCYRMYTQEEAAGLGVTGTVRNLSGGSVEVVAEGERDQLEKLITWLHKGPSYAAVQEVKVVWEEPSGEFREFDIVL